MKPQLPLCFGLIACLGLAGCQEKTAPPPTASHPQWLDVPALPILQSAVFSLADALAPHKNPLVMEQICALAKGETQQENVNRFIQQQGGNAQNIPPQGHPLSLLVNGDRKTQARACAAYLAISVLSPMSLNGLLVEPAGAPPGDKNKPAEKPAPQVDQAKLLASLPGKLAIAQTNADFFALIATELQHRPGLTLEQYRQLSMTMFTGLTEDYLQRLKEQTPPPGTEYKVLKLDADQFTFVSSTRTLFEYDFSGLRLQQNGMIWFGEGKLLGKDYFLKVAYLPATAKRLNDTPAP
ncbi:hypothetical protein DK871_26575 [Pseudomonas sp. L13]|nr:hypothetical protein [Pseudomonas sp. L13]